MQLLVLFRSGQKHVSVPSELSVEIRVGEERLIEPRCRFGQSNLELAAELPADAACGASCRLLSRFARFEDHDATHSRARELIGDRQTDDAGADNNDVGTMRQLRLWFTHCDPR